MGTNHAELEQKIMATLSLMVEWLSANKLALNILKTNILRFALKQSLNSLAVTSGNLSLNEIPVTKFLGLQIDKSLDWKSHVECIHPKLSIAIFAIRTLSYFSSKQILRMVYYFHSILKYGIIFWGNSTNGVRVLKLQKKVIRIMSGMGPRDSCRDLFRKLQILPLSCEYILLLMLFVTDNQTKFCSGSDFHGLNTRNHEQLYLPNSNLSVFHKGSMFAAIKLFNRLPKRIQSLKEDGMSFRNKLSSYLMSNSFYTITF
jgi:hypothetical protein